ncbi:hypothetical protein MYCTH_2306767 [Thermothelomyces thermophilus ATCC 42464]|uniref:Uncharacterized protein n=1 Tax=Thermothelomyces thermophilus (strain ATCC 42464 / BCRC 31852 / DSM 1799) TaxID=573729 RepID=G2QET3_THET4|nr:uncharacterized protein MYCTH_2306767 [Thermothelomyces thermophilus ATCC 42464]AEO58962.1 hypothetical protein MYCTH_2306767 [Thermothelomyces thermophilus ATCC 42464]
MLPGVTAYNSALVLLCATLSRIPSCVAAPWTEFLSRRFDLILDYSPAPPPEDGPPASAGALRDPAFLPAQIGGIVGAYALSLVLVALLLLALSKRRREHLRNRDLAPEEGGVFFSGFNPFPEPFLLQSEEEYKRQLEAFQQLTELEQQQQFHLYQAQPEQPFQQLSLEIPTSPIRNFSLPSTSPLSPTRTGPLSPTKSQRSLFTSPSPTSTIRAPGLELVVDQTVLHRDRTMAQQQLEEMYKYVMEHEQAKAEGREYEGPPIASPSSGASPTKGPKKERNKPSNLNLSRDDKAQSRGSSFLSFLKSPRKSKMNANVTISSPILTPMSGTFPRHDDQEMNAMAPRHYAPAAPPPVPSSSDLSFRRATASTAGGSHHLPTPDISPVSSQSIDSRIDAAIGKPPSRAAWRERHEREGRSSNRLPSHSHNDSSATSTAGDHEPVSASSERSTTRLVGLPASPRPNATRFPSDLSLPASPRPHQQSFQQQQQQQQQSGPNNNSNSNDSNDSSNNNNKNNASSSTSSFPRPSAVREGGTLPLRTYEQQQQQQQQGSSVTSPTAASFATTTRQTVFTRAEGPLSPGTALPTGMRTPWTGAPVPYSPYQPFSPVVPITPSVVTRADRKRMKKLEPRTPTVEMVRSDEELW